MVLDTNKVVNLFPQCSEAAKFVENQDYQQVIVELAKRISTHYHYVKANNAPICITHASTNEQILIAIHNKFKLTPNQIRHDLHQVIMPLLA